MLNNTSGINFIIVMAWLAVDSLGNEFIFDGKPLRAKLFWNIDGYWEEVQLPKGTIWKLIGKHLTWEDEPVEYK